MKKLNTYKLSDNQLEKAKQLLAKTDDGQLYTYPWHSLEKEFTKKGINELSFIGYGSLLNAKSAAQTFSNLNHQKFIPVVAYGVRRIFNYIMPSNTERYGPANKPEARAALNVIYTENMSDLTNGLLVRLPLSSIEDLRAREVGYNLLRIVCCNFDSTDPTPFLSYILCSPSSGRYNGQNLTSNSITPHHNYLKVCRDGAASLGDDFLHIWLNTTYLADGVTLITEWENK